MKILYRASDLLFLQLDEDIEIILYPEWLSVQIKWGQIQCLQ